MPADEKRYLRLHVAAFGWALSGALIVAFVMCEFAALAFPGLQATHAWVAMFTMAPVGSLMSFLQGIGANLVFGWIVGAILAVIYNRIAKAA